MRRIVTSDVSKAVAAQKKICRMKTWMKSDYKNDREENQLIIEETIGGSHYLSDGDENSQSIMKEKERFSRATRHITCTR